MSSSTPSCLSCLDELAGNPRRSRNNSFSVQISAIRGKASVADAIVTFTPGGAHASQVSCASALAATASSAVQAWSMWST